MPIATRRPVVDGPSWSDEDSCEVAMLGEPDIVHEGLIEPPFGGVCASEALLTMPFLPTVKLGRQTLSVIYSSHKSRFRSAAVIF